MKKFFDEKNEKVYFLALSYIVLIFLVGLFSITGLTSVTTSLNHFVGSGENDYIGTFHNIEQMDSLVYQQDLLISRYLMNPDGSQPSEEFYSLTQEFNRLYNQEYEYADSLEDINYTYHIVTTHNAFVDMFSRLHSYLDDSGADPRQMQTYYEETISPQIDAIHSALRSYQSYKIQEMETEKEKVFSSVRTVFTILFLFFIVCCIVCYYLFKKILALNLSPVYSILQQRTELEKTKSDFVSTISHEFKTPLTSIMMSADLLKNNLLGQLNADQEEVVDTLKEDSMRLTILVNNLLELSKIESANTVYAFEEKDMQALISNSLVPFLSLAGKSNVTLSFEPRLPLPPMVVDESKITWVMNNLLSNALKYVDEGGHITVRAFYDPGGFLQVSVEDDGIGIPSEYTEHIFERYFQVKESDIELGGTGLGLAVSKDIITAHGGRIWCESQLGKGSTFTFTIPVHPADENER